MGRLLFRVRYLLHAVIYIVGYFAPWNLWLHLDTVRSAWVYLAYTMQRQGWTDFFQASVGLLVAGVILALLGAALRTWGTAYLGPTTVQAGVMYADTIQAAGPYRYLRHPLYLGTALHTLALVLLMPPTGALFCLATILALQAALIASEESFLERKLGTPYRTYCEHVPRLVPTLRPKLPPSDAPASWGTACVAEIYFWGVAVSFAAVGWKFNGQLVMQGVLISFGASLVVRALLPTRVPSEK